MSMQVLAVEEGVVDEFLVRAPAGATAEEIAEVTELGGGRDVWVAPADVHEFVDLPARVPRLATRLVAAEADLAQVLRSLLGECVVEQAPSGAGRPSGEGFEASTMRLVDIDGALVGVTRPLLPFTPAEFARAKAVFELAQQLTGRPAAASGTELVIRRAEPADAAAVAAMHARCGAESRARRYGDGGPVGAD
ncbi:hypothetical protein [Amycolatopsis sp. MEPSY49]|uniref:hypothetical protein n=1 Tax=Amycolatopsis sp. MEPSY49 TaxID=3151600 RepID=UPI003EF6127E